MPLQESPAEEAGTTDAAAAEDSVAEAPQDSDTLSVSAVAPSKAPSDSTSPDDTSKNILKDISFDNLKFDMPIGKAFRREMLTEDVKQLDGQLIKIRGYMKPNFQQSNIEKFVLVRDNQACCFGPGAALYDCVLVMLGTGKATEFSVRPITVSGTMYLKEYKGPDGNIWAIFRMKNAAVE
jgi:hypothetical protein